MFGFIEKTFAGLLSTCTTVSFSGSLGSNSEKSIKCVSTIYIDHVKLQSFS